MIEKESREAKELLQDMEVLSARCMKKDYSSVSLHIQYDLLTFTNFLSSPRSVVVPTKKSSISSSAAAVGAPANAVSVVSSLDSAQAPDLSGESPGK